MPKTIDALREKDETTVKIQEGERKGEEEEDEDKEDEVAWDIENDEFKDYFSKSYVPKVLITSADNPRSVSRKGEKIRKKGPKRFLFPPFSRDRAPSPPRL